MMSMRHPTDRLMETASLVAAGFCSRSYASPRGRKRRRRPPCSTRAAGTVGRDGAPHDPNFAAKHAKPRAAKPVRSPGAVATAPAASVPADGAVAPNVGSGPAVPPTMASQMTISGRDLNNRAVTRPGEMLEAAPGLAVVAHADGGKANQYYLRGYNLDHGTDLAIFVDDMPINLPTHAHGQGYADLNWLMPETVNSLDVRKGPYFADVGDFATAGSLFINLKDSVDKKIARSDGRQLRLPKIFHHGLDQARRRLAALCRRGRTPMTVRGPRRTCAEIERAACATAKAPRPTAFRPPRWPIPTLGRPPTR